MEFTKVNSIELITKVYKLTTFNAQKFIEIVNLYFNKLGLEINNEDEHQDQEQEIDINQDNEENDDVGQENVEQNNQQNEIEIEEESKEIEN